MAKTQIVSYSEIDTYRQCPLKHQLAYKERWTKPVKAGGALDRGTLWHQVLEQHFLVIQSKQADDGSTTASDDELTLLALAAIRPLLYNDSSGEFQNETAELIWWMYLGYVELYGFDPQWKILAVEHRVIVPLLNAAGAKTRFRLKCKIDLVVEDLGMLARHMWVVDHKSGKDLPTQKALELDDQFGFYTLALQRLGRPVFGQIYDASRTQRNKDPKTQTADSRNSRTRLYRGDEELLAIEADAYKAMYAAYGPQPAALRGLDPYASPNTDMCKWKCDYLEPHLMARKTGDLRGLLGEFGFAQNFERH